MPLEPLGEADRIRLRHMMEAAEQALEFAQGRTRADLDSNVMFRRAVVHCLQEIGEAATHVTPPGRLAVPALPWQKIVGTRHRLVHVYFAVNLDLVWETLAGDLPPLVLVLRQALRQTPP